MQSYYCVITHFIVTANKPRKSILWFTFAVSVFIFIKNMQLPYSKVASPFFWTKTHWIIYWITLGNEPLTQLSSIIIVLCFSTLLYYVNNIGEYEEKGHMNSPGTDYITATKQDTMKPCTSGPITRYVKLRVAHEPGMPGTFFSRHRL